MTCGANDNPSTFPETKSRSPRAGGGVHELSDIFDQKFRLFADRSRRADLVFLRRFIAALMIYEHFARDIFAMRRLNLKAPTIGERYPHIPRRAVGYAARGTCASIYYQFTFSHGFAHGFARGLLTGSLAVRPRFAHGSMTKRP